MDYGEVGVEGVESCLDLEANMESMKVNESRKERIQAQTKGKTFPVVREQGRNTHRWSRGGHEAGEEHRHSSSCKAKEEKPTNYGRPKSPAFSFPTEGSLRVRFRQADSTVWTSAPYPEHETVWHLVTRR